MSSNHKMLIENMMIFVDEPLYQAAVRRVTRSYTKQRLQNKRNPIKKYNDPKLEKENTIVNIDSDFEIIDFDPGFVQSFITNYEDEDEEPEDSENMEKLRLKKNDSIAMYKKHPSKEIFHYLFSNIVQFTIEEIKEPLKEYIHEFVLACIDSIQKNRKAERVNDPIIVASGINPLFRYELHLLYDEDKRYEIIVHVEGNSKKFVPPFDINTEKYIYQFFMDNFTVETQFEKRKDKIRNKLHEIMKKT